MVEWLPCSTASAAQCNIIPGKKQIFIQRKKTSRPLPIDLYIAIVYSSLYADDILTCVWDTVEVASYSGSISSFYVFVVCSTEFKELALIHIKAIFLKFFMVQNRLH